MGQMGRVVEGHPSGGRDSLAGTLLAADGHFAIYSHPHMQQSANVTLCVDPLNHKKTKNLAYHANHAANSHRARRQQHASNRTLFTFSMNSYKTESEL